MQKILKGQIALTNLKAIVKNDGIMFPVSAESKFIAEDGRSFGYPVDEGWITEVFYEPVKGVLADDTVVLFKDIKNFPKCYPPSSGVMPMKTFNYSDEELNSWKKNLSFEWAYKKLDEEIRKNGVEATLGFNETIDEYIDHLVENYWNYPQDWRDAYDAHNKTLGVPVGNLTKVLVSGALELFKDDNDDFFFKTQYHNHGKLEKADKDAALDYIRDYQAYSKLSAKKNKLIDEFNCNIELLRATM